MVNKPGFCMCCIFTKYYMVDKKLCYVLWIDNAISLFCNYGLKSFLCNNALKLFVYLEWSSLNALFKMFCLCNERICVLNHQCWLPEVKSSKRTIIPQYFPYSYNMQLILILSVV